MESSGLYDDLTNGNELSIAIANIANALNISPVTDSAAISLSASIPPSHDMKQEETPPLLINPVLPAKRNNLIHAFESDVSGGGVSRSVRAAAARMKGTVNTVLVPSCFLFRCKTRGREGERTERVTKNTKKKRKRENNDSLV